MWFCFNISTDGPHDVVDFLQQSRLQQRHKQHPHSMMPVSKLAVKRRRADTLQTKSTYEPTQLQRAKSVQISCIIEFFFFKFALYCSENMHNLTAATNAVQIFNSNKYNYKKNRTSSRASIEWLLHYFSQGGEGGGRVGNHCFHLNVYDIITSGKINNKYQ